jgi:pyrrolysine biosynthesis protein PylC
MLIALIGGKLQGVELTYLAHKAGWEVMIIDRKPAVPASGLCDQFIQLDVKDTAGMEVVLKGVDLVIPATENRETLDILHRWCSEKGMPLAFDADAYAISSSKLESDRLFARNKIPAPLSWPDCGFPLIAKPSSGSGSEGVQLFTNPEELKKRFPSSFPPEGWVVQEYLEGPSYSLEVVGVPGHYIPLQITDLEMDAGYDCKRVLAPTKLLTRQRKKFEKISVQIAEAIQLRGLMDVEVILHNGKLKVLEIDARFPSQTPTAVYHSTGINMIQLLPSATRNPFEKVFLDLPKLLVSVIYEHIRVSARTIEVCGEHVMADAGPLHLEHGFFDADEAITNYAPGRTDWVATLITTGRNLDHAWRNRCRVIHNIEAQP